jgi:S1-C subfamily serine protease
MQKIVIRHLTGMKANQVEDIPLQGFREVLIGRDSNAHIRFDADREDLVSRNHARIVRDPSDANAFLLTDLDSRNGSFVNRKRVYGASRVQHGDCIQLGPAGPEFAFELDPPPAARPTRLADSYQPAPATREASVSQMGGQLGGQMGGSAFPPGMTGSSPAGGSDAPRPVGRATVERMLGDVASQMKGESRKTLRASLVGIGVLLLAGTGYFFYDQNQKAQSAALSAQNLMNLTRELTSISNQQAEATKRAQDAERRIQILRASPPKPENIAELKKLGDDLKAAQAQVIELQAKYKEKEDARKEEIRIAEERRIKEAAALPAVTPAGTDKKGELPDKSAAQISNENLDSVVMIEAGWKLVDPTTGRQLYFYHHSFDRGVCGLSAGDALPVFIETGGKVRPVLATLDNDGNNEPITGEHRGTGFLTSSEGFILTNRHVLAPWRQPYETNFSKRNVGIKLDSAGNLSCLASSNFPTDWSPMDGSPLVVDKLVSEMGIRGKVVKNMNTDVTSFRMSVPKIEGKEGKSVAGAYSYLHVIFAKTKQQYNAEAVTISDRHDVAVARVSIPGARSKGVTLFPGDPATIKPGQPVVVMGYPVVSVEQVAVETSRDMLQDRTRTSVIADPTTTGGLIGKVISDARNIRGVDGVISSGEVYQLGINTTGGGNSGGPVFNSKGEVIGILYAKGSRAGASVTFAVPISYGIELISAPRIVR